MSCGCHMKTTSLHSGLFGSEKCKHARVTHRFIKAGLQAMNTVQQKPPDLLAGSSYEHRFVGKRQSCEHRSGGRRHSMNTDLEAEVWTWTQTWRQKTQLWIQNGRLMAEHKERCGGRKVPGPHWPGSGSRRRGWPGRGGACCWSPQRCASPTSNSPPHHARWCPLSSAPWWQSTRLFSGTVLIAPVWQW